MSIEETDKKGKSSDDIYEEEEFDIVGKSDKASFKAYFKHFIVIALILLAAGASFSIGQITHYENVIKPVEVKSSDVILPFATTSPNEKVAQTSDTRVQVSSSLPKTQQSTVTTGDGTVVASKTGTKYYFPWCGSAKRILDANKVYFSSIADARKAGLLPSSTCKGLK